MPEKKDITTSATVQSLMFLSPEDGRRFLAMDSCCDDLKCRAVHLSLVEVDAEDRPVVGQHSSRVSIDVDTWRELPTGERSPAEQCLVEALIADLDDENRAFLRDRFDASKEEIRRIASYVVPPDDVRAGLLISYTDIVSGGRSLLNGGDTYYLSIVHAGTTWVIDDLYCSNPECDCRRVDLLFARLEETPDGMALESGFRASWSLSGRARVDEASGCSKSVARAVLSAWRKSDPGLADALRQRYGMVKEIGERSLATAPSFSAGEPGASRSRPGPERKVGRNEPCPCGSGRKYKRCCGKTEQT